MTSLIELSDPPPDPGPADWNDEGIVYLPGLIPDRLIEAYEAEWREANGYRGLLEPPAGQWTSDPAGDPTGLYVLDAAEPGGWNEACPYMHQPALLALATYEPLCEAIADAIGETPGLHLNLTGWVSTLRNWHQDGYLNPEGVGDSYAAVWIALGDVHRDSGVFQYVPGSHQWHRLTREKIAEVVDISDDSWPEATEAVLTPLVDAEIEIRDATVIDYVPNRGDVLLWHPRLYHRGSVPAVPGAYRPALIAHYSGASVRPDMPEPIFVGGSAAYFPILTSPRTRSPERAEAVRA